MLVGNAAPEAPKKKIMEPGRRNGLLKHVMPPQHDALYLGKKQTPGIPIGLNIFLSTYEKYIKPTGLSNDV
jgi:hypothetical protein